MNLKALKTEIFKAKAFGNTRYGKSDNEEKACFQDFGARSDSTPMAPPIPLKRLLKRRRGFFNPLRQT